MLRTNALLVLLVIAPIASSQCTIQAGLNCTGSDLEIAASVTDTAGCCAACRAHPDCRAFTFSINKCFLKADCAGASPARSNTVSGLNDGAPQIDCKQGHAGPAPTPAVRPLPRVRPSPKDRTFHSPAVEQLLSSLMNKSWRQPELATILWNCFPNTLDTTVWQSPGSNSDLSFISTGDIAAMWLRDSQNQVMPYMRLAKAEPDGVGSLIRGLLRRHVRSVLLDPYANSFDYFSTLGSELQCNADAWVLDNTTMRAPDGQRVNGMKLGVHQRKWEMDSLGSVLKLSREYEDATGDMRPFDSEWLDAVELILQTFREMQAPLTAANFTSVNYTFQTVTREPKDTSAHGIGRSHRWTGMVRTSFLPSDDSPRLPYHIPGNAFAVVELRGVARLLRRMKQDRTAAAAEGLAQQIQDGIEQWGVVQRSGKQVYAMEVDGFGNFFFGDDANVPSLLALPFMGYLNSSDPTYLATRALLLSNTTNPYFYGCGTVHECGGAVMGGIGSEDASGNAGLGHVWPLSLITRLLTVDGDSAEADAERMALLESLVESTGGTGLIHESYWYSDPRSYTRFWFAMGNSYMGEVLLRLAETRPHLLFTGSEPNWYT